MIFISYKHDESEFFHVPEVANQLLALGSIGKVLYSERDVVTDFVKYIDESLGACNVVVLFCSPAASQSEWVQGEWRAAYAQQPDAAVDAEVREVLEAYRGALQQKDLDRLAALYVRFSPRQREALQEYLQNAAGLIVELSDITVAPHSEGVAVSYTRRDRFIDTVSGKPQRLEVRLTKILVRDNGQWKMASGQ